MMLTWQQTYACGLFFGFLIGAAFGIWWGREWQKSAPKCDAERL